VSKRVPTIVSNLLIRLSSLGTAEAVQKPQPFDPRSPCFLAAWEQTSVENQGWCSTSPQFSVEDIRSCKKLSSALPVF